MTKYVVGWMMDSMGAILMIRKNKPAWQAGKLNGVGGKVEEGESGHEAMVREFEEETGVKTETTTWRWFALVTEPGYELDCYIACVESLNDYEFKNMTSENLEIHFYEYLVDLSTPTLPSVKWLLPMAIHSPHGLSVKC